MMELMETRRMCPHCRAFITTKDRVCPYCNETVGPKAVQQEEDVQVLGGVIPHVRFNTSLILLINVGLYLGTALYSSQHEGNSQALFSIDGRTLVTFGANYIPALRMGQWWRLLTAGFLHGGLLHIGMNLWVLFDLGAQVEAIYGGSRMWVIYFVATICGFYFSAFNGNVLSVGASAGLMGLIGAMIAFGMRSRTGVGREIRAMYIRWAVYILAMGLIIRMTDNSAHIGGVAAGFAVAYLAGTPRVAGAMEKVWQAASWIAVMLTGYCFLQMYLQFAKFAQ
jgi:rhomboid protease GluP